MRVLLDECLPRKLTQDLSEHQVRTVQDEGGAGLKNGALLQAAAGRFDVLLTVDRNISFQQNLQGLHIAVIAMTAMSNRLGDLRPIMPQVRRALSAIRPGQVIRVGGGAATGSS
jgi:predicted nuclease of predicted toxin-antitoxin system